MWLIKRFEHIGSRNNQNRLRALKIDLSFRCQTKIKKKGGEVESWELRGRVERFCWELIYLVTLVYLALFCFSTTLHNPWDASKLCLSCAYGMNEAKARLKQAKSFGELSLNNLDLNQATDSSSEIFVSACQLLRNP